MHNKYIITYECHDNAPRMWKVVQLEKYFDFSLYSHHFSLLSLTSLLSAPEREVTSPSGFKVVGALITFPFVHYYNKFLSPTSILECNSHKIKIHVYFLSGHFEFRHFRPHFGIFLIWMSIPYLAIWGVNVYISRSKHRSKKYHI